MLLKKQVIFFNVQGLNFDKFLKQTKKDNIDLYFVKRTQHNLFTVGVYNYQKEKFLSIAAKLNLIATIESRTRLLSVKETIKKNIAIFSLEMPAEQLILRMISSVGQIDNAKLKNGKII